jgi:hypothetical protein
LVKTSPDPRASAFFAAKRTGKLMGDVVNLNRFKKRAARDQAAKEAHHRRARFGRTKAERQQQKQETQKLKSVLDHHRIGEDET